MHGISDFKFVDPRTGKVYQPPGTILPDEQPSVDAPSIGLPGSTPTARPNRRPTIRTRSRTERVQEKKVPLWKTFVEAELGYFDTVFGALNADSALDAQTEQVQMNTELIALFRRSKGEQRVRLGQLLKDRAAEGGGPQDFASTIPSVDKSYSQVLGEAISVGLLVAPVVSSLSTFARETKATGSLISAFSKDLVKDATKQEVKNFIKTDFFRKTYRGRAIRGAVVGAGFSGAFGLSQKGELAGGLFPTAEDEINELRSKVPSIAVMTGVGAIGGAILDGFLPFVWSKAKGLSGLNNKAVKVPIARIVESTPNAKITNLIKKPAISPLTTAIDKSSQSISRLEKEIIVLRERAAKISRKSPVTRVTVSRRQVSLEGKAMRTRKVSTFVNSLNPEQQALLDNAGVSARKFWNQVQRKTKGAREVINLNASAESLTAKADKIQKTLAKNEAKKATLIRRAAKNNLKVGDTVILESQLISGPGKKQAQADVVPLTLQSFGSESDTGRIFALATDADNNLVTILPDDVMKLQKYEAGEVVLKTVVDNVADLDDLLVRAQRAAPAAKKMAAYRNVMRGFLRRGAVLMEKLGGDAGAQLVKVLDNSIQDSALKQGGYSVLLKDVIVEIGLEKNPLTKAENKNLVNILDAGFREKAKTLSDVSIKPINERVKKLGDVIADVFRQISDEAREKNITIRDIYSGEKRKLEESLFHFPHMLKDESKLIVNTDLAARRLADADKISIKEAKLRISEYTDRYAASRYAGLERSRTILINGFDELEKFGYETDALTAVSSYIRGASKRLSEVEHLGLNDEVVQALINRIGDNGYDRGLAEKLWVAYKGNAPSQQATKLASEAVRSYNIISKLKLGAITNMFQPLVNDTAAFGFKATIKGYNKFFRDRVSADRAAILAGVSDEVIQRMSVLLGADTRTASKFLQNVGFTSVENSNRVITVAAVQSWADDAVRKLVKRADRPGVRRTFKRLGIDNLDEIISRGTLTAEELNKIGQRGVDATQFRYSVLDVPLLWDSPYARVATQFQSYSFQQGRFVKEYIFDEMMQGNWYPMMTFATVSMIGGEVNKDIRSVLKSDFEFRADKDFVSRMVDNVSTVAGLGIAADYFEDIIRIGSGSPWISAGDFFVGPAVSDADKFVRGIGDLAKGDTGQIAEFGARNLSAAAIIPGLRDVPGSGVILGILGDIIRFQLKDK